MLQQRHSKYLEAATSQLGYKLWSQFTTHCCWKEAEGRIIALTSQVLTYHTPPPVHGLSRNECSLSTGGLIVSRCTRSFSRYCMLLECLFWLQSVCVCVCVCADVSCCCCCVVVLVLALVLILVLVLVLEVLMAEMWWNLKVLFPKASVCLLDSTAPIIKTIVP